MLSKVVGPKKRNIPPQPITTMFSLGHTIVDNSTIVHHPRHLCVMPSCCNSLIVPFCMPLTTLPLSAWSRPGPPPPFFSVRSQAGPAESVVNTNILHVTMLLSTRPDIFRRPVGRAICNRARSVMRTTRETRQTCTPEECSGHATSRNPTTPTT